MQTAGAKPDGMTNPVSAVAPVTGAVTSPATGTTTASGAPTNTSPDAAAVSGLTAQPGPPVLELLWQGT